MPIVQPRPQVKGSRPNAVTLVRARKSQQITAIPAKEPLTTQGSCNTTNSVAAAPRQDSAMSMKPPRGQMWSA